MQLIQDWLKGSRNFFVGRSLYKTFGSNDELKRLFDCGTTESSSKTLLEEMQKLVNNGKPMATEKIIEKSIEPVPLGFDDVSKSLAAEWKRIFGQIKLWQHKLQEYGNDNSQLVRDARFEIADRIKTLEKELQKSIATYDYYKEHKRLPDTIEPKSEIPTDPLELAKFISNCERYVRKYRKTDNPNHVQLFNDYLKKYKLATGKDYEFKN